MQELPRRLRRHRHRRGRGDRPYPGQPGLAHQGHDVFQGALEHPAHRQPLPHQVPDEAGRAQRQRAVGAHLVGRGAGHDRRQDEGGDRRPRPAVHRDLPGHRPRLQPLHHAHGAHARDGQRHHPRLRLPQPAPRPLRPGHGLRSPLLRLPRLGRRVPQDPDHVGQAAGDQQCGLRDGVLVHELARLLQEPDHHRSAGHGICLAGEPVDPAARGHRLRPGHGHDEPHHRERALGQGVRRELDLRVRRAP